jgi:methylated-DNA-[protein]-cysteine S-methyltransferase
MYIDYMDSPLGLIEFKASDKGISQVIFCGDHKKAVKTNAMTDCCKQQLCEYFSGQRKAFDLPLVLQGTDFQQSIWACLSQIPFGKTMSYGEIAHKINNPKSVRAVGGANGRNPVSIIVPCHRVIGANGTLTGYAGGIARKLWLLNHEGITLKNASKNDQLNIQHLIDNRQDKTQFLK